MFTERMEEFKSELTAGWNEATGSDDQVVNTKITIKQAQEAQKALSKIVAVSAKLGGVTEVLASALLGKELAYTFDGYSNASVMIALSIELMACLDVYIKAVEEGVKLEEAKGRN